MERANLRAKNTLVGMLDATLQREPSADLTKLLGEQARAYALLRRHLAESAPNRRVGGPADEQSDASNGSKISASDIDDDDNWKVVLLDGSPIQIDYALDPRILGLACPGHEQGQQPTQTFPTGTGLSEGQFAAGLNKAFQQGEVLWRLFDTIIVGVGASVVVKASTDLDPDGASNLKYINENLPAVPAPTFLGAITCGRRSYVFQSRARGVTLEAMWPDLSTADKLSVQAQLSDIFRLLRAGPSSPHSEDGRTPTVTRPPQIGSFVSGVCKDTRRNQRVSEAPIDDEAAFNDFLVRPPPRRTVPIYIRTLRPSLRDDHPIVMTHADLHPRNIMAEWVAAPAAAREQGGNGKGTTGEGRRCVITSIIDWDMAGWYPAYWEYVKTLCNASPRGPLVDWLEYLPTESIGTWPVEYALDHLLGRWLG